MNDDEFTDLVDEEDDSTSDVSLDDDSSSSPNYTNGYNSGFRYNRNNTNENGSRIRRNNYHGVNNNGNFRNNSVNRVNKNRGVLNNLLGRSKSSSLLSKLGGKSNNKSSTEKVPLDLDKKAKVILKGHITVKVFLIFGLIFGFFIFLLIFISVILMVLNFKYDDKKNSSSKSNSAYLSQIYSNCESLTVNGKSVSLDDYVANVVANEIGNNAPYEAKKAQAIAVRTYVIKGTNNCKNEVSATDESFQVYNENVNPTQDTIDAVSDTSGMVMLVDGTLLLSEYDSFCTNTSLNGDGVGGYHCDDEFCYATYAKSNVSGTIASWQHHEIKVPANGYPINGGHCHGMSQSAAMYMANNGYTAEEILEYFYDSNMTIETMASSDGLEATDNPNYMARVSRATRDNPYFYDQSTDTAIGLEGECAWYGYSRAKEILALSGSSKSLSRMGNGGEYCDIANESNIKTGSNVNKPKEGSLIVWSGGSNGYGHVAVIEKVYDDGTVFLSEAAIGFGLFGSSARNFLWTDYPNYQDAIEEYGSNALARKENCEGNGTGCQRFSTVSVSDLANYGGQTFNCYVYLLDD